MSLTAQCRARRTIGGGGDRDDALRARLRKLSAEHPRWGYRLAWGAATLVVVELDEVIERTALSVDPALRALDAIHLATALAAADSVAGFVCYDARLAAAAESLGLTIVTPA